MNKKAAWFFAGVIICTVFLALFTPGCKKGKTSMDEELKTFITEYEAKIIPLFRDMNIASFEASISGKPEDYKRYADLQVQISMIYSDTAAFARLEKIKAGTISDTLLARQFTVIYNSYKGNQIESADLAAIITLAASIEEKFNTSRVEFNGKKVSDNELEEILKTSVDSKQLEDAYIASKVIGSAVADDVLKLVRMRNAVAKKLGYKNYHQMSLILSEQDPAEIDALMDELDSLTRGTFAAVKQEMDSVLAERLGIPTDQLMPWHYQNRFFQQAPVIYSVDLDSYYKDKDIVKLTTDFFAGIGLPIDEMVAKSDLFEKEGKYQHAFCTHMDRSGDVRVICNIKPNSKWMDTMLHEFGHAVYDRNLNFALPWALREPAHTFTTEAIAMLFGRLASNPQWLVDIVGVPQAVADSVAEASFKTLRLEQLVFSRWAQVVYRFEKSMYENPDQDLSRLWWNLVEKYQMLKKPEGRNRPDWAAKIHIALYPAYYHNYQLGELLASQLHYYIAENILKTKGDTPQSYVNRKEVGTFMKEKLFAPARYWYWNDMIEKATGEKLTAKYFARQFVNN